jgi:hypothetical protein
LENADLSATYVVNVTLPSGDRVNFYTDEAEIADVQSLRELAGKGEVLSSSNHR